MVLPEFDYSVAATLEEACRMQAQWGASARVMAGGTDTVPPMKDGALKAEHIISIVRIPGLNDIQTSKLVQKVNPAVAQSAKYIASTQVCNRGTLVGNICNASPFCDTGSILAACNARVQVQGVNGSREIPMDEFFTGVKRTSLDPRRGKNVTSVIIPPLAADEHAAYLKHSVCKGMDLAIVGVAAWVKTEGDVVKNGRIFTKRAAKKASCRVRSTPALVTRSSKRSRNATERSSS